MYLSLYHYYMVTVMLQIALRVQVPRRAKNPKGGGKGTDDEGDGGDIEAFDVIHFGNDSDSEVDLLQSRLLPCLRLARSRCSTLKEQDGVKLLLLVAFVSWFLVHGLFCFLFHVSVVVVYAKCFFCLLP